MNKLELADRLNLYYKLGTIGSVGIRFTAEEQVYITRIDASQTFEDAAQIAQDLFTHCKNSVFKLLSNSLANLCANIHCFVRVI